MSKSLEELRANIQREVPYVDIKPYSHNIIGSVLRQIVDEFGEVEANNAIDYFGLESLGWRKQPCQ
jgi:hypothetical protein